VSPVHLGLGGSWGILGASGGLADVLGQKCEGVLRYEKRELSPNGPRNSGMALTMPGSTMLHCGGGLGCGWWL